MTDAVKGLVLILLLYSMGCAHQAQPRLRVTPEIRPIKEPVEGPSDPLRLWRLHQWKLEQLDSEGRLA